MVPATPVEFQNLAAIAYQLRYDAIMHFTDEQPFLDAIFARYADDRPRLVYADYLDDRGQPERAELVRVQLALARLSADDPRRPPLVDRQHELLNRNRTAWTAHLAGLVASIDFRRGVPDSVSVDTATFLAHGEALFERLRVRRLRLLDPAPVMEKLSRSPLLSRVLELDLCGADLGNSGLYPLTQSPHLTELRALDIGFNGLDNKGVESLARSSHFPSLDYLALSDNERITYEGFRTLVESPFFAGLAGLDASGNEIAESGIQALTASPSMARLRALRINGNPIGDGGAAHLARSALFTRLLAADPRVELRGTGIGTAGAAALAASPALAACISLDLTNNYLGDRAISSLLGSPFLAGVKVINLARNQLTDSGVAAMRNLFDSLFGRLRVLDLSHNRLTRTGLGVLTTLRGERPVRLELSGNVQSVSHGDAPLAVADSLLPPPAVPAMGDDASDATRLKRRIAHPRDQNRES
jgi:uncharacterized protein (TIGR02996 family)